MVVGNIDVEAVPLIDAKAGYSINEAQKAAPSPQQQQQQQCSSCEACKTCALVKTVAQSANTNLLVNVLAFIGVESLITAIIYKLVGGFKMAPPPVPVLVPIPGGFIGIVWTVLFSLMAAGRWQMVVTNVPHLNKKLAYLYSIFIFCNLFSFFTAVFYTWWSGFLQCIIVWLWAGYNSFMFMDAPLAHKSMLATMVWVTAACTLTYGPTVLAYFCRMSGSTSCQ